MSGTGDNGKYEHVATELRRRIEAGDYSATSVLPPTAELAGEFGVAVKTVQRALQQLDHAGLTMSRQGRQRMILTGGNDASATRYEQVASELIRAIQSGELPAGGRVPGEKELAEKYDASRATVRVALGILESSGQVVKRAGRRYVAGEHQGSDLAYERIAAQIEHAIKARRYADGRLPGENRLAAEHGVSRPTVRQALIRLQSAGLIHSAPKQGWFVARREGL